MKVLESIREGLTRILKNDSSSLVLGEDLVDPYGGAFKITKGLSTQFPDRVIQTPISEAGFSGLAIGMAYRGLNPIVEIMFGDFITIIADMVINSGSKFGWLSQGKMKGRVLFRAPMGGRRGYGPIHSQSVEKLFLGWPDVSLFAPNIISDPGKLLEAAYKDSAVIKLFVENKQDYGSEILDTKVLKEKGFRVKSDELGTVLSNCEDGSPNVVIACYGGMVRYAIEASIELFVEDEETSAIFIPSKICPLDINPMLEFLNRGASLLIVEEGYSFAGWGSYCLGLLSNIGIKLSLDKVALLGSTFTPIPAGIKEEEEHLPSAKHIVNRVKKLIKR